MADVVVVGGGLAGLVAARHLAGAGHQVTVCEAAASTGGRVESRHRDGFVLDRGFQVVFDSYPALARELDVAALDLQRFPAGATIARPGRRTTVADPMAAPTTLPATLASDALTVRDAVKLGLLRREVGNRPVEDLLESYGGQSIAAFLDGRGFSRRFRERFAGPFWGGITLDRSLSVDAGVFAATFACLNRGRACLPAEGMGAIARQLDQRARTAGATIHVERSVDAVDATEAGVSVETSGETIAADAAVVATDAPTARGLTGVAGIPPDGRGCTTLALAKPGGPAPLGKRLVVNGADDDRPNQVAALSAVAPSYAPDDQTLLSATFLGVPDADDEALADRTRAALDAWFPERRFDDLELLAVDRIPYAQAAQPPGFRADRPDPRAPSGPVVLAGEYTDWSSIQGALSSGRRAAAIVDDGLSGASTDDEAGEAFALDQ